MESFGTTPAYYVPPSPMETPGCYYLDTYVARCVQPARYVYPPVYTTEVPPQVTGDKSLAQLVGVAGDYVQNEIENFENNAQNVEDQYVEYAEEEIKKSCFQMFNIFSRKH